MTILQNNTRESIDKILEPRIHQHECGDDTINFVQLWAFLNQLIL